MAEVLRRSGAAFRVLDAISKEDMKYDRHSAFSISVNHRDTFTGVTDVDRAKTVSRFAAIAKEATKRENGWAAHVFAEEFRSPGHVPLLNAVQPLLVERRGHTELTTALMLMAGLPPPPPHSQVKSGGRPAPPPQNAKAHARAGGLRFLRRGENVPGRRFWSV